ncbi:hypothetical protein C1H46_018478 [Malus baccata]|uniref:Plant heme peroxidase family profile domain-containing protein n=1 Tax=Malus baccata TaxID=106549 RepID=A0A540MAY8_MALBA|nr:hypothetical protein C1H46_018478 [Malus baccata]
MAPTTSTAFLLCSSSPSISPASSSTAFPFNFIFPAKSPSTVNFRANPLHAVSAATSGGMDGSIVYELDRPENKGLKSPFKACPFLTLYIDIIEKAKSEVDAVNPVSWADMIAVAGAEAVSICGGPTIQVPLGRLDAKTRELVALSGAHTIGNKGFGNPTVFDNTYFKILLDKPSSGSMIGLPSVHLPRMMNA